MELFYSALKGGTPQTGEDTIEKLVSQVSNCTLLQDRRAAVLGLKAMSKDWKLLVGTKGLDVLVKNLIKDRADVETIKATLETLNVLCSNDQDKNASSQDKDLGIMFTEIFTKDASNVALLLDILEETDFYIRFDTIQLFNTLLRNSSVLHDAILASPMGISRLIDLLDDSREIIRNEGLLLLIALTKSNAEIQKIVAFENAFEKVLGIIIEEGAADGGIIVQDCLELIHNLLRFNVSNQTLFRESTCIQKIPNLFGDLETNEWSDQKIQNSLAVLELVRILVAPKNSNSRVNQNVFENSKILELLISMSLELFIPHEIKSESLCALGETLRGNRSNSDKFFKKIITQKSIKIPAILLIMRLGIKGDHFAVRASSVYAFECFVYKNPDAQVGLAATLLPPPGINPNDDDSAVTESGGSLLITSLFDLDMGRKDPWSIWFATVMLSHVLFDNHEAKTLLLNKKITDEEEEPVSLLHKVVFLVLNATRQNADVLIIIGILCLISTWLYECQGAVEEFVNEGSNIQFLVEQITQSSGVHMLVQGLSSFVLGLCHEFNNDSSSIFKRSGIYSLITNRIGLDIFTSRLERLRDSKELSCSHQTFGVTKGQVNKDSIFFDLVFSQFFKSTLDSIIKPIINFGQEKKPEKTEKDDLLRKKVVELETTISNLKGIHSEESARLKSKITDLESIISTLKTQNKTLESANATYEEKLKSLEKDQEDLFICLADQDIEITSLREELSRK